MTTEPLTIIAQFSDAKRAEAARLKVEEILRTAQQEVDALFARQGGVAEAAQVAAIYARFGFRNDIGWSCDRPIHTHGEEVFWELPEGLLAEEAELLLTALGAQAITTNAEREEEFWRDMLCPMTCMMPEDEDDFLGAEENEMRLRMMPEKKTLH